MGGEEMMAAVQVAEPCIIQGSLKTYILVSNIIAVTLWAKVTACASIDTFQGAKEICRCLGPTGNYMYHQSDIHRLYVLPTQCIYVFCVDLRTNSDYFTVQH
jgi:hypothetical protein